VFLRKYSLTLRAVHLHVETTKLAGGYVVIKDLITALMAESIENASTKSQYKVI